MAVAIGTRRERNPDDDDALQYRACLRCGLAQSVAATRHIPRLTAQLTLAFADAPNSTDCPMSLLDVRREMKQQSVLRRRDHSRIVAAFAGCSRYTASASCSNRWVVRSERNEGWDSSCAKMGRHHACGSDESRRPPAASAALSGFYAFLRDEFQIGDSSESVFPEAQMRFVDDEEFHCLAFSLQ